MLLTRVRRPRLGGIDNGECDLFDERSSFPGYRSRPRRCHEARCKLRFSLCKTLI